MVKLKLSKKKHVVHRFYLFALVFLSIFIFLNTFYKYLYLIQIIKRIQFLHKRYPHKSIFKNNSLLCQFMKTKQEVYTKESFEIGKWAINLNTNTISWDAKTRELFEVNEDFIPNFKNCTHFINRKNFIAFKTIINEAFKNDVPSFGKIQIITANKTIKLLECICQIELAQNQISRIHGTFKGVNQPKDIEKNLCLLSLIGSETTDSIIITNAEGEAIWANQAYMKLSGSTLPKIIGKKPDFFCFSPQINSETLNKITQSIQQKTATKVVFHHFNKQNQKYWLELNITPVFNENGICSKFIAIGRDITATKEKEIELKELLEVTSQQNNKLLNFTHIVSHNIRSHTSNLQMVLDVIENTDDINEKLTFIDMFKEGTEKLAETVENLNEVITIQKNSNINKTSVHLKSEIEKVSSLFHNKIAITQNIPGDLNINVIPAYLENMLQNLVTNAIKYQSPERIPRLEISYQNQENYHIILFKDNGLGINTEKHKHKLFGMYKTFHGNDDAKGIGLFIVKNQIEAMNGKIELESTEGLGSTFKLYFDEK